MSERMLQAQSWSCAAQCARMELWRERTKLTAMARYLTEAREGCTMIQEELQQVSHDRLLLHARCQKMTAELRDAQLETENARSLVQGQPLCSKQNMSGYGMAYTLVKS